MVIVIFFNTHSNRALRPYEFRRLGFISWNQIILLIFSRDSHRLQWRVCALRIYRRNFVDINLFFKSLVHFFLSLPVFIGKAGPASTSVRALRASTPSNCWLINQSVKLSGHCPQTHCDCLIYHRTFSSIVSFPIYKWRRRPYTWVVRLKSSSVFIGAKILLKYGGRVHYFWSL